MACNEQFIIIYTDPKDHRIRKYATAYTDEQCKHYLMKCLEKIGRNQNVRAVPAKDLAV